MAVSSTKSTKKPVATVKKQPTELRKADPTAVRVVDTAKKEIKSVTPAAENTMTADKTDKAERENAMKSVGTKKEAPKKAAPKKETKAVAKEEPKKAEAKEEPKKAAAKEEPKKAAAKEAPKKVAAKEEPKKAAAKEEPKKAAAKEASKKVAAKKETKAEGKKTTRKETASHQEVQSKLVLQYGTISIDQDTLLQNIHNYLKADKGIEESQIQSLDVYVKPEEGRAYVVVNGEEQGSILL